MQTLDLFILISFRIRLSSLPSFMWGMQTVTQRRHGYSPHHCIQITSFQCQGKRVEFDSFRWFFIGNWGTAGEKPRAPPSHLRVSHDQTTLWIDTSLSNTGLLAAETKARRTDGCQQWTRSENWDEGWTEGVRMFRKMMKD